MRDMVGRVVIAEDDAGLAFAFGRIVERLGYEVAVFNNSVAAWDDLKTDQRLSLLITEIVFPPDQPNGIALAAHAGVLHRHLPVIYITGYPRFAGLVNKIRNEMLLVKPVEENTLTQWVQQLAPLGTRADWHPADIAAALKNAGTASLICLSVTATTPLLLARRSRSHGLR
jgi:DNA-binding NtrC family response regulator